MLDLQAHLICLGFNFKIVIATACNVPTDPFPVLYLTREQCFQVVLKRDIKGKNVYSYSQEASMSGGLWRHLVITRWHRARVDWTTYMCRWYSVNKVLRITSMISIALYIYGFSFTWLQFFQCTSHKIRCICRNRLLTTGITMFIVTLIFHAFCKT